MTEQTRAHSTDNHWKKQFALFTAGQTVSVIGSSAVQFALIWWLATESASPLVLSLAGLLAFLPQLLLGPFAGVWVDRMRRKTVIVGADLAIGAVAGALALLFVLREPSFGWVILALGVRAIGSVFHTPAVQAAVPLIVPPDRLVRANGWSQLLQSGAYMLGPGAGAAMYASLPMYVILLTDLAGAIVACLTVVAVRIPEAVRQFRANPHFLGELKEGLSVFARNKRLRDFTVAVVAAMIFFLPLSALYPLMTSQYFRANAWEASVTQIAYSLGMMGSAAAVGFFGTIRNKLGAARVAVIALGAAALLCGLLPGNAPGLWIFAGLCFAMGGCVNLYSIPYMSCVQETVPPEAQGRVFSLLGTSMSAAMPIGLLLAGPVAEQVGVPGWFAVSGAAIIGIMLLYDRVRTR